MAGKDPEKRLPPRSLKAKGWIVSISWGPDSRTLASAAIGSGEKLSAGGLTLWDGRTGSVKKLALVEATGDFVNRYNWGWTGIAISPDGKTIAASATGSENGTKLDAGCVLLWDAESGKLKHTLMHPTGVFGVVFSPDGKRLAAGNRGEAFGQRELVRVWDVKSGKPLTALNARAGEEAASVAFSPDGKTLAVRVNGSEKRPPEEIVLWKPRTAERRCLPTSDPPLSGLCPSLAFSPDGKTLALGGRLGGKHVIVLWDVQAARQTAVLEGHGGQIFSMSFSPDGRTLASGSADGTIKLWDLDRRREREKR